MNHSNAMRVILGVSSLKAYVAAPKAFHVLGIVRFGLEYGLLATNAEGLYFRVNGSQALALDSNDVRRAIHVSYGAGARIPCSKARDGATHPALPSAPLAMPTVRIRKHRLVPATATASRYSLQAAPA